MNTGNITYVRKSATLDKVVDFLTGFSEVACDLEWDTKEMLTTVQFAAREGSLYVIDMKNCDNLSYFKKRIENILYSKIIKIFHFSKNDIKTLYKNNIKVSNTYCTFVMEKVITGAYYTTKGYYSLVSLVKRYIGYEITEKEETRMGIYHNGITSYEDVRYCAADVFPLIEIYDKQLKELDDRENVNMNNILDRDYLCGLENTCAEAFAEMEYNGINVNMEKLPKAAEVILKSKHEIKEKIDNLLGVKINLNSPVQKLRELRKIIPDLKNTKKDTLLLYKDEHEIFEYLVQYNALSKLDSSYIKSIPKFLTLEGKIHPKVNQILTTGRISVSEVNTQQLPSRTAEGKAIRNCFEASEGSVLCVADYSNVELRIIADLSQDPLWKKIFEDGLNLHDVMTKLLWKVKQDQIHDPVPSNPDISYRSLTKNINFG